MRNNKLLQSVAEESVSYVTGIPIGLIRQILRALTPRWLKPHFFVDWELANWAQIYRKELEKCVALNFRGRRVLIPAILVLDNTQRQLPMEHFKFKRMEEAFTLSDELKARTERIVKLYRRYCFFRRHQYYNEKQLRLASFEEGADTTVFHVHAVKYEDVIRTNLAMDARDLKDNSSLRDDWHCDGKVGELTNSPLGNSLGVNFLLFTADGKVVMQLRARKVIVRPGELASTCSGAFLLSDVFDSEIDFTRVPKLREAFEEIGLDDADIEEDSTSFLGLTRELIRGGKPELFFVSRTRLSANDFRKKWREAKDRYESRALIFFDFGRLATCDLNDGGIQHDFRSCFDALLDRHFNKLSIPLWTHLALWQRYRLHSSSK